MIPEVHVVRWTGKKPNKNGELPIKYQVCIEGKAIPKASGWMAKAAEWDATREQFTGKVSNSDIKNITLRNEKHRIERDLLLKYNQVGRLNFQMVHDIVHGSGKSLDFFAYCETYIKANYQGGTLTHYLSDLRKLKGFRASLSCADIDPVFLKDYEAYCREQGNGPNTVWKAAKFLRTMVKSAVPKLIPVDPYKEYKMPRYKNPKVVYLDLEELEAFWQTVATASLNETTRLCGLYFLRQCYSSLRVGDNLALRVGNINKGWIVLTTQKTGKEVRVPIRNKLQDVVDLIGSSVLMVSQVHYNRSIKEIANLADIKKHVTSHTGRHTFGYLCAKHKIPPHITQKIMGHSKIETTMIYYHLEDAVIADEMDKFDAA
jgi:integrase/recombinase XerD